jgi:hypothetical protein
VDGCVDGWMVLVALYLVQLMGAYIQFFLMLLQPTKKDGLFASFLFFWNFFVLFIFFLD